MALKRQPVVAARTASKRPQRQRDRYAAGSGLDTSACILGLHLGVQAGADTSFGVPRVLAKSTVARLGSLSSICSKAHGTLSKKVGFLEVVATGVAQAELTLRSVEWHQIHKRLDLRTAPVACINCSRFYLCTGTLCRQRDLRAVLVPTVTLYPSNAARA